MHGDPDDGDGLPSSAGDDRHRSRHPPCEWLGSLFPAARAAPRADDDLVLTPLYSMQGQGQGTALFCGSIGADVGEVDPKTMQIAKETSATDEVLTSAISSSANDLATDTEKKLYPGAPTFKECLAFALPALGIYVCSPLMSLIDASFVGRGSSVELAALGPASCISDGAPLPLLFLSIASTNLIAKSHSEGDDEGSARVARTAIGAGGACGTVLAAALYALAHPISGLYCGAEVALAPLCARYVAIRAMALPAVVITTIAQAVCIGTKDTRTPMISVGLAGCLNFLGDLVLVKLLGKGLAGAAWATSLATAASLGGVRAAAHTALISVALMCMTMGDVGSSLSQAFLPPFATKDEDGGTTFDVDAAMPTIRQLLRCTLSISATVMCLATLLIGALGGRITGDPRVLAEMRRTLPWIVATLGFHGSAVTLEGVLLSGGKFRGLTANYAFLAITVAAFQVATRKFDLGLAGVWGCYLWFCSSRVVTFSTMGGLLRRRRWRRSAENAIA
ncbi:hypothetical protein THAOC_16764 [Thalassiosira oceanica]|uniref:Polysaccharide biosynthesis protein C-terminal domain-containing protein n=1 Tax=Thalassiosira oceanica TaxID=159749 RepID=K0SCF4_THAOC|nr:hypothetical protein THAOC_16764 [Thalassiosira oceanica]|eukprot:EJK62614.1 hypothetical protein THAOC_16764 [Thalassiosira oceanica]